MNHDTFQAPSPESLAERLPQYDVEFFIAQGGMGAVYKGRQLSLDRDIAIKVLPHEVGESEEFRESFISEAKAMARLNHSNLLGVFDYGTVDGMPYIVMEYVSGGSLHQAAYNQAVEHRQAAEIVKGICAGLAHAHEHGIVHRDIKPSNILLTQKLEPKVADFGLAHAADSDTPGLMMGTPGYTAPEVFQDPNLAGAQADIYSVGVILHQLLTGIDPAGCMEPPTQPSGNLRLDAIWRKATNVNPALRYPTVAAMESDLDKCISAKQTAASPAVSPLYSPRSTARMQTASGGGGFMGKLVGAGVVAALVFVAYLLFKEGTQEPAGEVTDSGTETSGIPAPAPVPEEPPVPVSLPGEDETPSVATHPEPIKIIKVEEPVTVAVVDDEPEKPKPEPPGELEPGDPELRQRAIGLIGDARKKRDKELSDNASALHFNLRTLSRAAGSEVSSLVDDLKDDIVDNRIPLVDEVYGLPEEIEEAFEDSLAKEKLIDDKYNADLTRIRDAYITRLKDAAAASPDKNLKMRLLSQSAEANDINDWIRLLAPEPERVVRRSSGGLAVGVGGLAGGVGGSFLGKWEVHENGTVQHWIAHSSGRLEIFGEDWKAVWEMLEDGAVEVRFAGKRPYGFRRNGADWVRVSGGTYVILKRGDR